MASQGQHTDILSPVETESLRKIVERICELKHGILRDDIMRNPGTWREFLHENKIVMKAMGIDETPSHVAMGKVLLGGALDSGTLPTKMPKRPRGDSSEDELTAHTVSQVRAPLRKKTKTATLSSRVWPPPMKAVIPATPRKQSASDPSGPSPPTSQAKLRKSPPPPLPLYSGPGKTTEPGGVATKPKTSTPKATSPVLKVLPNLNTAYLASSPSLPQRDDGTAKIKEDISKIISLAEESSSFKFGSKERTNHLKNITSILNNLNFASFDPPILKKRRDSLAARISRLEARDPNGKDKTTGKKIVYLLEDLRLERQRCETSLAAVPGLRARIFKDEARAKAVIANLQDIWRSSFEEAAFGERAEQAPYSGGVTWRNPYTNKTYTVMVV